MDFKMFTERIKNLIINPAEEWRAIKEEPDDKAAVIREYALPFIVLLALSNFLGILIFKNYVTIVFMVVSTLVVFIGAFLSIHISASIINQMAPSFGSIKDITKAYQLVIYSYTAVFITHSIANLIPPLFFIVILGLYSVYILWVGLGILMETPEDKKMVYMLSSALVLFVVYTLLNFLLGAISTSVLVSYGMNTLT